MSEVEELLKQVEDLHMSMIRIKEGEFLPDFEVKIESQILDIVLYNFRETLIKKFQH
jgi:hypothetical protein